jgi:hypothetical protein
MAAPRVLRAQEGGASKTPPVPTRQAKVERLFKAPARCSPSDLNGGACRESRCRPGASAPALFPPW